MEKQHTAADYLQNAIKEALSWQRDNFQDGFLNPQTNKDKNSFQFFINLYAKAELLSLSAKHFAKENDFEPALVESTTQVVKEALSELTAEFWNN
jgi:hypothetical protein